MKLEGRKPYRQVVSRKREKYIDSLSPDRSRLPAHSPINLDGLDAALRNRCEERTKRVKEDESLSMYDTLVELVYLSQLEELANGGRNYWKFGTKHDERTRGKERFCVDVTREAAGVSCQGRPGGAQEGDGT